MAGGYLHFLRSFLEDVPVGEWSDAAAGEVAGWVRLREGADGTEAEALEEWIERSVETALGLPAGERAAVEAWADLDPNWTARERIRRAAVAEEFRIGEG